MTTDLGKDQARAGDDTPRQRGGAHAAAKNSRFRRKDAPAPAQRRLRAPPPAQRRLRAPRRACAPSPARTGSRSPREPRSRAECHSRREPCATILSRSTRSRRPRNPVTPPTVQEPPPVPEPSAAPAPSATSAPGVAGAVREAALNLCALAIVATVIPLVMIQIPDAVAWVVPPRVAAAGPGAVASLLRASGLALPAMAVAGSLAALMVRWLRAGPVLLTGLLILAAADALGGVTRTVALIGVDRALHGAGAGIAMAGVVAVVAERRPRRRPQPQAPNGGRRALAGCWAAFTVAGLATAPELMRHRVGSGDWVVALQPFPWLTGAALVLGALYALLAEGTAITAARSLFPAAERAQLALLTVPVAGICAIALAVTYPGGHAVTAAAVADALALAGIAVITARAATAARFAVVCAVTGFTVSPAAGAVTALTRSTAFSGGAVLIAALGGAGLALLTRHPHARAVTATGLSVTAVGLAALDLAGPAAASGHLLALLCLPVAGGLAAALAAALRTSGATGALAGVVILLAGLVAGYLAAGAVQLRAIAGTATAPAARAALATAAGHWALVAAAVTGAVALAMAGTPVRNRARPGEIAGATPVLGAGAIPDHG